LKNKGLLINKKRLYRILSARDRFASGEKGENRKVRIFSAIGGSTSGGNLIDCFTKRLLLQIIGYSLPSSVMEILLQPFKNILLYRI